MEGYTDHQRRLIATESSLEPAARLLVLLHETAHALLHDNDADYVAHRGVCETEAESTAYVIANLLGMDVDASSVSYVAGWAKADRDVITQAATNVLRAVNTIAAALGLDADHDDDTRRRRTSDGGGEGERRLTGPRARAGDGGRPGRAPHHAAGRGTERPRPAATTNHRTTTCSPATRRAASAVRNR